MEQLLIIGGKGSAVNIAEQIQDAERFHGNQQHMAGFLIDDESLGASINGIPIVGKIRDVCRYANDGYKIIFALYKPEVMKDRMVLRKSIGLMHEQMATFIHPNAYISASASIGPGSVIMNGCSVHANSTIGESCIMSSNVTIEHDSVVGSDCFFATHSVIGSHVKLGVGCFIGISSSVRECVEIGSYAFVGMHSLVLSNVNQDSMVFGVPAREKVRSRAAQ